MFGGSGEFVASGLATINQTGIVKAQGATASAGQALTVGGNVTYFTWTSPNDGNLHQFTATGAINVTVNLSGGNLQITWHIAGQLVSTNLVPPNGTVGVNVGTISAVVDPGTVVTVKQQSGAASGSGTGYASIVGA